MNDISRVEIMFEPLLMEHMVSGLCVIPDLSNPEVETADLMDIYKKWARIPEQTHSCNVAVVDQHERYFEDTDALITFERDVPVGIRTADCVPILIYSPDMQCIGAIHAGWKGTLGGIVDNVLDILEEKGVDTALLRVAFGPSISKDMYEVDRELAERFIYAGFGKSVVYPNGDEEKPHIDLQGVNMERFVRRGVRQENISLHAGCSYGSKREDGSPLYASHRRSGGAHARMLTCIMMLSRSGMDYYRMPL